MFFVLDENHNLIEAYDKEGVLAVLEKAIADGSLSGITEDSAFVSKLKCCVTGGTNKVAFVTQAKYNELKASGSLVANCLYIVTDDTTASDIDAMLSELTNTVNAIMEGTKAVPKADVAEKLSAVGFSVTDDNEMTIHGCGYITRSVNSSGAVTLEDNWCLIPFADTNIPLVEGLEVWDKNYPEGERGYLHNANGYGWCVKAKKATEIYFFLLQGVVGSKYEDVAYHPDVFDIKASKAVSVEGRVVASVTVVKGVSEAVELEEGKTYLCMLKHSNYTAPFIVVFTDKSKSVFIPCGGSSDYAKYHPSESEPFIPSQKKCFVFQKLSAIDEDGSITVKTDESIDGTIYIQQIGQFEV